jgi:hypothetical protein
MRPPVAASRRFVVLGVTAVVTFTAIARSPRRGRW